MNHYLHVPGSGQLCVLLQVKKWTAGQSKWTIVSMFLAVANFAAAPTGASLITRFLKQPQPQSSASPVASNASLAHAEDEEVAAACTINSAADNLGEQPQPTACDKPDAERESGQNKNNESLTSVRPQHSTVQETIASLQEPAQQSVPEASADASGASVTPAGSLAQCVSHKQSGSADQQAAAVQSESCAVGPSAEALLLRNSPDPAQQSSAPADAVNTGDAVSRPPSVDHEAHHAAIQHPTCSMQGAADTNRDPQVQSPSPLQPGYGPQMADSPAAEGWLKRSREQADNAEPAHRKQLKRSDLLRFPAAVMCASEQSLPACLFWPYAACCCSHGCVRLVASYLYDKQ